MWIEALIAVTFLSGLVVLLAPNRWAAKLALGLSLLPLVGSLWMYGQFDATGNALTGGTVAFGTNANWVNLGQYALNWHVGLDGISMPMVVLTTVLTTLAILGAWSHVEERESQFYGLVLLISASLLGVYAALDFFVWFVFWEAVLIPMYFLIGIWGGPRRRYAAIKFFVYTNLASLVMFIGFLALVFGLGDSISSLSLPAIAEALRAGQLGSLGGVPPGTLKTLAFAAMFAGFAVKVPIVPFHTWLPDAYVEAPAPVSVLLAGVVSKMGVYALLRFNFTMLPDVARANAQLIALLAVVSVIYGALLAVNQQDLKRIVAYSSIPSMGFVVLGLVALTPYGLGGAAFQMVSHGLIAGLLFLVVGAIYRSTDTRMVADMSGLAKRKPTVAVLFIAGAFAYMGLPLMSGFAAELYIFLGAFQATFAYAQLFTAVAMFGIVIIAGYYLFAMQRTLFGAFRLDTDVEVGATPLRDTFALVVLVLLVVALGIAPDTVYTMIQHAVTPLAGGVM